MKSSVRLLVCCAQVIVVSGAAIALANCGGGERPLVNDYPTVDASGDTGANDTKTGVTLSGFDPAAGIVFGDNGLVNCGSQAPDKVITLKNGSPDIVNFKAKIAAGTSYYKLSNEEGGIPARGEATLQIIPSPIPQESDVTPDLYAGTLEITFSTGEPPTVIRLHQTARGAIITTTLAAGGFDFGAVKVATTGSQQFSMTNTGNVEVTATLALGGQDFKIDNANTASVPLKPAQTTTKTLTLAPADTVEYTDTLALSFNSAAVHCKAPPGSTNLKGKGTTSVGVSPGTINFGQVDCGKTANYQKVTITSTAAMSFTPVLIKGEMGTSPYTLANDANGDPVPAGVAVPMAAASTFVLRVVPNAVSTAITPSDNALGDTLRIETTAPGDTPHLTTLNQTPRGAVFEINPKIITVKDGPEGHKSSTTFTISNTGNMSAPYVVNVTLDPGQPDADPSTFESNLSTGTLQPGSNALTGTLNTVAPPTGVQVTGKLTLDAGGGAVLCRDVPPYVPLFIENKP